MGEKSDNTFFITTPIYYVNDVPHIGHAYTTIIADAISRFKKQSGAEVFFLTGTDEHGQKIERAASKKGLTPIQLADRVVIRFQDLWKKLNISYDYFIRTTEPFHEKGVQKIFQKLKEKGDIFKGIYKGYYCVSCENFLAEDIPLEEKGFKICPDCGKEAGEVSEKCYFFKLSAYQKPLLDFYASHPKFIRPQSRMNEVVSFVNQGLKDLSITRTTVKWGIPVPSDSEHTIYVWFDALHNYVTAIGYDWDQEQFAKFWPANIHLIGKDILRFHAIFWPAFLMAAGFAIPETIFGHGWWLKDKTKMSKSKGNVLDPHIILDTFGADPLRYFLLREVPIGMDGNFSHEGFVHRANSDLANDLGNLVQRILTMIGNYFGNKIENIDKEEESDMKLRHEYETIQESVHKDYNEYAINKGLENIWNYINAVNKYLADNEPWILAKNEKKKGRLGRILYQAASALRGISYLVYPVMPESAEKIWSFLGEAKNPGAVHFNEFRFDGFHLGQEIKIPEPLFPRISLKDFLKEESKLREEKMEPITFEEFKRMDLRVGEIIQAEKVEGTDKLLKLKVNLGTEERTMVAGVADVYSPEDLLGKKLVVIVNLMPAVIRGIESQAMLLAAEEKGKAIIPFFDEDVAPGAKVK